MTSLGNVYNSSPLLILEEEANQAGGKVWPSPSWGRFGGRQEKRETEPLGPFEHASLTFLDPSLPGPDQTSFPQVHFLTTFLPSKNDRVPWARNKLSPILKILLAGLVI